jgi:hypothetical protein
LQSAYSGNGLLLVALTPLARHELAGELLAQLGARLAQIDGRGLRVERLPGAKIARDLFHRRPVLGMDQGHRVD